MVRTRGSESGRNNPPLEGMPLTQEHVAAMEARIAQMSPEMATLIEQNLRLLGQIQGEQILEESDENYDGESNIYASRNVSQRAPKDVSHNDDDHYQDKRRRLSEVVASLYEKYNRLQQEMNQQEKGKTSMVDNLLHGRILAVCLPKKFKVPSIAVFTETEDLTEHLDNY